MPPKKKAKLNPTEPRRPTTPPYEKAAAARPQQSAAPLVKFLLDETDAASEIFSRLDPASFATLTRACADLFHGFKARARECGKLDQAAFLTTVPRFKWAVENGLLQLGMGLFRHALRMNVKRAPWQCAFAFGELPASYDYYASWRKAHLESDDAVTILRRLLTDFSGAFDGRSLTREMREDMSADVAAAGSVDVIKFVATVGNSGWTDEWRDEWGNSIPKMFTFNNPCAQKAAAGGHLDALKYLREELSCDWCGGVVLAAAEHGHVEIMLWAINNGCECEESPKYAARAALHGRRNVLEVLRNLEYPFDELVTANAALGGHLDLLKWLRSESFLLETITETGETWGPCPWDEYTTANAAGEGGRDVEVLRFARENGCPWDGDVYLRAQEWKRPIAFEWALKNGCPFPTEEDIKYWLPRAKYENTPPFVRFMTQRIDSTGAKMNPKALLDELYSHFAHHEVTTLPDMSHLHDYDPDAEA